MLPRPRRDIRQLLVVLTTIVPGAAASFQVLSPPDVLVTTTRPSLCVSNIGAQCTKRRRTTCVAAATTMEDGRSSTRRREQQNLETAVRALKKVLEKEYVSFFDPMEREYYSADVTFEDPMTSLAGVDAYQNNVDMLASRTLMGSLLFEDAGIVLHDVTGGEIMVGSKEISDIITRWTLFVTAKVLPWKPTARFSGISVYDVKPGGPKGVIVTKQTDYWDSINLKPSGGGEYGTVDKGIAVKDFLGQLKPNAELNSAQAAPELVYQLLRRGSDYDVRRYPAFTAVRTTYQRRDEAFDALASATQGLSPLSPALIRLPDNDKDDKTMMWPMAFARPGEAGPPAVTLTEEDPASGGGCAVVTVPERVVAVARYSDASLEPVVRRVDERLRKSCARDGLKPAAETETCLQFAQYDAIFSLGKRRGEVWIDLERHPW